MEFFLAPALVFVLIAVHETGHYFAGLTAGIPAAAMRIRLFTFPQHVALRDGAGWVSPVTDIERFVEVSRRYLLTRSAAFRWVAGGIVAETGFTAIACVLAVRVGWILDGRDLASHVPHQRPLDGYPLGVGPPSRVRRHKWIVGDLLDTRPARDTLDAGDSSRPRVVRFAMNRRIGPATPVGGSSEA
jgi:hypothetical protein